MYGPGDEALLGHSSPLLARVGRGEEVKVLTRSGVAKILKVQLHGDGPLLKLDREVRLSDGSLSAWVSDREVTTDLTKGAPDALVFARRQATGNS